MSSFLRIYGVRRELWLTFFSDTLFAGKKIAHFFKKHLIFLKKCDIIPFTVFDMAFADVAELADALASGASGSNVVWVQVPSSAPSRKADWFCPETVIEVWLSLVERCVRDAEAVGSSPVTSTSFKACGTACRAAPRFFVYSENGFCPSLVHCCPSHLCLSLFLTCHILQTVVIGIVFLLL